MAFLCLASSPSYWSLKTEFSICLNCLSTSKTGTQDGLKREYINPICQNAFQRNTFKCFQKSLQRKPAQYRAQSVNIPQQLLRLPRVPENYDFTLELTVTNAVLQI